MIPRTLGEIAKIVGGRLHHCSGDELVTGTVEFDSREIGDGGLFVAMPGERVDGHDFAARAVAAGAVGVLAAREVDAPAVIVPPVSTGGGVSDHGEAARNRRPGAGVPQGTAHVRSVALAGDTDGSGAAVLAALAALARDVVDQLAANKLTVVGVTGSSGKTSTKDLIAQVLEPMGPTVAPPGSFNNELGHPWTALRADEHTRHLVLELSARGLGHIAALCATAPPKIGVVLNVGTAHLGEFGSREDIARTKGELVEALPAGGVAVLNADDPLVAAMAERTAARVVLVGEDPAADFRAIDVELDDQARASFRMITPSGEAAVRLGVHGAHQVGNALAAAAVAVELGADPEQAAARLSAARRISARRMEVSTRADGVTVINDSYNANPESVRAALTSLATMSRTGDHRRSWAVLGVMGELGEASTAAHEEIGRHAVRLGVDRLVVVGDEATAMHHAASGKDWRYAIEPTKTQSVLVPDVDAAAALLRAELRPGDVVLVKASKVAALWRVADALLAPCGGGA